LSSGDPIICISGVVNEKDCAWAIESLDELITEGERRIVFDFSGVEQMVKQWLVKSIRKRELEFEGDLKIRIRDKGRKPGNVFSHIENRRRANLSDTHHSIMT